MTWRSFWLGWVMGITAVTVAEWAIEKLAPTAPPVAPPTALDGSPAGRDYASPTREDLDPLGKGEA